VTKAVIAATGLHVPPAIITNAELVAAYNAWAEAENAGRAPAVAAGEAQPVPLSSAEFIEKASGIRQRHVIDKLGVLNPELMRPDFPERDNDQLSVMAELGVAAAKDALARWGKPAEAIGAVICAASAHQRPYPAMAIEIQQALGASGFAFDMNVACSSATFAVTIAADFVKSGMARAVLVVSPEIASGHLNYRDRDSHFIFGDVAVAAIVEAGDQATEGWEILGARLKTQFSNNIRNNFGFLNRATPEARDAGDKLFNQAGRKVFKEVPPMVSALILDHAAELGLDPTRLKRLWLHQANISMNEMIGRKVLGREPEPGENVIVLPDYANTGAAGSIIAFHEHREGLISGDLGLICSFGAGYSIGCLFVRKR
jgi:beta-ketodecanoyl-[acyl-carrier-protein] synthase